MKEERRKTGAGGLVHWIIEECEAADGGPCLAFDSASIRDETSDTTPCARELTKTHRNNIVIVLLLDHHQI